MCIFTESFDRSDDFKRVVPLIKLFCVHVQFNSYPYIYYVERYQKMRDREYVSLCTFFFHFTFFGIWIICYHKYNKYSIDDIVKLRQAILKHCLRTKYNPYRQFNLL